jgi:hypothetical protein
MLCTLLPTEGRPSGFATLTPGLVGAAIGMAVLTGSLMGVGFPRGNRPFARLASVDGEGAT